MISDQKVFNTAAELYVINNKALAICLKDVTNLNAQVKNPHMTVIYRQTGFQATDIEAVTAEIDSWKKEIKIIKRRGVSFTLKRWGKSSDLVEGALKDLCLRLRDKFRMESDESERKPHVAMRRKNWKKKMRRQMI
mmetsp:Transcript_2096/g.3833  ORF Transcript_2096/g.3833 Transcript_2096/m.3833 type:complete len:136 (+) Transcript_2096:91-498(+)